MSKNQDREKYLRLILKDAVRFLITASLSLFPNARGLDPPKPDYRVRSALKIQHEFLVSLILLALGEMRYPSTQQLPIKKLFCGKQQQQQHFFPCTLLLRKCFVTEGILDIYYSIIIYGSY